MRLALLCAWLVVACGETEQPQSRPVMDGGPKRPTVTAINVDANTPKPVGIEEIGSRLFAINGLPVEGQRAAVAALNLVPSPCVVCDGMTLAECLVEVGVANCPVLDKLTKRAVRMAKNNASTDLIKVEINYPDLWFPRVGSGKPVTVHLYRDADGRFAEDVNHIRSRLLDIFGADVRVVTHEEVDEESRRLGVRSRPTWFVNGHRFRGVQSVDGLARFVAFELADES